MKMDKLTEIMAEMGVEAPSNVYFSFNSFVEQLKWAVNAADYSKGEHLVFIYNCRKIPVGYIWYTKGWVPKDVTIWSHASTLAVRRAFLYAKQLKKEREDFEALMKRA